MFSSLTILLGALTLFLLIQWRKRSSVAHVPLPPGPKKRPIIGNLLDMPKERQWIAYQRWGKEYDTDILHLEIPGASLIILNTHEAAIELLDRRSRFYSSRPTFTMFEISKADFNFGFLPYNDRWRARRRAFHQNLREGQERKYYDYLLNGREQLLQNLMNNPEGFTDHFRYSAGSAMLNIAYGLKVKSDTDKFIRLAEHAMEPVNQAAAPGAYLVNHFPILKHIPDWFPGAGFKQKAKEWSLSIDVMLNESVEVTRKDMAIGEQLPSFVSESLLELESLPPGPEYTKLESVIKDTAGIMYLGGTETTAVSLATFILAMMLHPEIQRKARAHIAAVVTPGTLPAFDDEPSLPYISAIVLEVMRWRPAAPFGLPHYIEVDDIYNGYRIPAGSSIIANVWAIAMNEDDYPNANQFNPDRFMREGTLDKSVRDPRTFAFGYGRRICPGRHLVYSSLWINIVSILAMFEISRAVDTAPDEVLISEEQFTNTTVSGPKVFKCSIKPYSKEAEKFLVGLNK